ncbi:hypothetical protein N177_1670 [Lutibaculum baratangense AMV1]|uniref:Uncharacterized protein n=2 Tax=Lutibaculum TaxID=1358438 RepID=V4THQ1_9HYPH|nr:hypothetical protein N177_1670 [Lutibaculum baratangense AMV1]
MGNRGGRLHDPATRELSRRRHVSKRWIACALEFGGRHRTVWGEGYTELFFLDEVTALAAGHRPCFECRRGEAEAFASAAAAGARKMGASEMDDALHRQRLGPRPEVDMKTLPEGSVGLVGGVPHAVRGGGLLPWHPEGWGPPAGPVSGPALLVTPSLAVEALRDGYRPLWHPSAF